jgi:hypothetical protein
MLKRLLKLALCLFAGTVSAQKSSLPNNLSHELAFTTENDAYLFHTGDAYYTNGFFLRFTAAGTSYDRKLVRSYEAGQMIFTPLIRKTRTVEDIDRPYCGYLFGRYSETTFPKKDAVLQYSLTLGLVGKASLGEALQESYHRLFSYSQFTGWQYQVRNSLGADIGLMYAPTIWEDSSWAKLMPVVQASLGTDFTNARIGAFFCVGAFEKNANSVLWNARVQRQHTTLRRKSELFVYWNPELLAQAYNVTVQGGMFDKGTGAVLTSPQPLMFNNTVGLCYAEGPVSIKMGVTFQAREAVGQTTPQQYGSFQFSCRLR